MRWSGTAVLTALTLASAAAAQEAALDPGATIAFLGLKFLDTSAEGEINGVRADETERLAATEAYVRDRLTGAGFALAHLAPVAEELAATFNPSDCNGCDVRMAAELGADYALVGEVQKVSNLILSMNLVLRDVGTGAQMRMLAVDIRGNTDESWMRGARYILDHEVLAAPD